MFEKKRLVAIIPARGGSRRIPEKNLAVLDGRPLIFHTIKAALKSEFLDSVYVSTDNKSIALEAKNMKIPVIKRPSKYAGDFSKSVDVVKHSIKYLKDAGHTFDAVVLLQPTSPFRLGYDIDKCIEILFKNKLDSAISLVSVRQLPEWMLQKDKKGLLSSFNYSTKSVNRTRKLSELFYPNGAVYVSTTKFLMKQPDFVYGGKCGGYVMDNLRSIDIDTEFDLQVSEKFFKIFRKKYHRDL